VREEQIYLLFRASEANKEFITLFVSE